MEASPAMREQERYAISLVFAGAIPASRAEFAFEPRPRTEIPKYRRKRPKSRHRASTTAPTRVSGMNPNLKLMASITASLMRPSEVVRNIKETPCNAMNVASVATIGCSPTGSTKTQLKAPTSRAITTSTTMAPMTPRPDVGPDSKNDWLTTIKPMSGPTDRSMPPTSMSAC